MGYLYACSKVLQLQHKLILTFRREVYDAVDTRDGLTQSDLTCDVNSAQRRGGETGHGIICSMKVQRGTTKQRSEGVCEHEKQGKEIAGPKGMID